MPLQQITGTTHVLSQMEVLLWRTDLEEAADVVQGALALAVEAIAQAKHALLPGGQRVQQVVHVRDEAPMDHQLVHAGPIILDQVIQGLGVPIPRQWLLQGVCG